MESNKCEPCKLSTLEPGDIFIAASDKSNPPKEFIVNGMPVFNHGHGSSTRKCVALPAKVEVSKSCRLDVIKVRESKHKQQYMDKFLQPKNNSACQKKATAAVVA